MLCPLVSYGGAGPLCIICQVRPGRKGERGGGFLFPCRLARRRQGPEKFAAGPAAAGGEEVSEKHPARKKSWGGAPKKVTN